MGEPCSGITLRFPDTPPGLGTSLTAPILPSFRVSAPLPWQRRGARTPLRGKGLFSARFHTTHSSAPAARRPRTRKVTDFRSAWVGFATADMEISPPYRRAKVSLNTIAFAKA